MKLGIKMISILISDTSCKNGDGTRFVRKRSSILEKTPKNRCKTVSLKGENHLVILILEKYFRKPEAELAKVRSENQYSFFH